MKKSFTAVLFVSAVVTLGNSAPPSAPALRILCLGDSITQGNEELQSWRYPLWTRLVDADRKMDFVGTQRENFDGNPEWPDYKGKQFDSEHEARWGWTARKVAENLPVWLKTVDADVALIHLGTNDVLLGRDPEAIVQDLKQVVDALRQDNPRIQIHLALLLPAGRSVRPLNEALAEEIPRWSRKESPVYAVDMYSGFDLNQQTVDGLHPSSDGEDWMAERWFRSLQLHAPADALKQTSPAEESQ